jgi:hypothetical protein
MSWKSREKKRRAKAAVAKSRRRYPDRWYLTIVSRRCSCNRCGAVLREGGEMLRIRLNLRGRLGGGR